MAPAMGLPPFAVGFRQHSVLPNPDAAAPATPVALEPADGSLAAAALSGGTSDVATIPAGLMYATKELARDAFQQLLSEMDVHSSW